MTGMLWQCDDPKQSWAWHIEKAANHYRQKYHAEPITCAVHPTVAANLPAKVCGLVIRAQPLGSALCIWIGDET